MTLEEILELARREIVLPEQCAMQRLLLLLADDSARLMRRVEAGDGRRAAHALPIEDCHRILLRSLRLLGDLRVSSVRIQAVFSDWERLRAAETMVAAHVHRFRQAVEGAIIAKFDFEADEHARAEPVREQALHLFRAAAQLAASAQGLTPGRFASQLSVAASA